MKLISNGDEKYQEGDLFETEQKRTGHRYWQYHKGTPDEELDYDPNEGVPEESKIIAYKQFLVKYNPEDPSTYQYAYPSPTNPDKLIPYLYPLYINADYGYKIGKWYKAGHGDYAQRMNADGSEWTDKRGKGYRMTMEKNLSFRPGDHAGSQPSMRHRGRSDLPHHGQGDSADFDYFHSQEVFAIVELTGKRDYTEEAKKRQIGKNVKTACFDDTSQFENGYYRFKTNNAATDKEAWYIAYAMKIIRVISDEEMVDILEKSGTGIKPQMRGAPNGKDRNRFSADASLFQRMNITNSNKSIKFVTEVIHALESKGYKKNVDFEIKEVRDKTGEPYVLAKSIPESNLSDGKWSYCSDKFKKVMDELGYTVGQYTNPEIGRFVGWLITKKENIMNSVRIKSSVEHDGNISLSELSGYMASFYFDLRNLHLNTSGDSFYTYHEVCQDLYEHAEEYYDDLVETATNLGEVVPMMNESTPSDWNSFNVSAANTDATKSAIASELQIILEKIKNIKDGYDSFVYSKLDSMSEYFDKELYKIKQALKSSRGNDMSIEDGWKGSLIKSSKTSEYHDYHIDTMGMGILEVEHLINQIEADGKQATLTVKCSDGTVYHSHFSPKRWIEFKNAKNSSKVAITDVWVSDDETYAINNSADHECCGKCGDECCCHGLEEAQKRVEYPVDESVEDVIHSSKEITSANNYGWEVKSDDAWKALDMWREYVGDEQALDDIARALGNDSLSNNMEYIYRVYEVGDYENFNDAWDAYEYAKDVLGSEELLTALAKALGYDELAEDMAFIFRMNDFREWDEANGEAIESDYDPMEDAELDLNEGQTIEHFPQWAVSYAMYGEGDDLTEEEKDMVDACLSENSANSITGTVEGSENGFDNNPCFGLPCETVTVTI